jgi:bla regulator protein blaR1
MIGEIINHLWQSTVFAAAVALLVLAFRKNRAEVRYWLWLSASLKFLVPFSLLISLGIHLWDALPAGKIATPIAAAPVSQRVVEITQPFPESFGYISAAHHTTSWIPIAILALWAFGFFSVVLMRTRSWFRIRAAVRASTSINIDATIPVRSSKTLLEPGVAGFLNPVLLLPEGILKQLTPPQLEAVLAHEQCHVRRRDNLTSAFHMLVETFFWFHPAIWWIGAKLVEERERACDEAVLKLGNEPQIYAEGILNVCKSYLESPLRCVSGVTGADLKKRIREILTASIAADLSLARKIALAIAIVVAFTSPILVGLVGAPSIRAQSTSRPEFEVISIKPDRSESGNVSINYQAGRFTVRNFSLKRLINNAYSPRKIVGDPSWLSSEKYDIDAKVEDSLTEKLRKLPIDQQFAQVMLMLQSALEERFQLKVNHESQDLPVYVLVIAKGGPKLTPTTLPPFDPEKQSAANTDTTRVNGNAAAGTRGSRIPEPGHFIATGQPIAVILGILTRELGGQIVLDQTGLKGEYDFTLKWTPDSGFSASAAGSGQDSGTAPLPDPSGTSIFTALKEQLGLKLETKKAPVDVLVITHVERPSPN